MLNVLTSRWQSPDRQFLVLAAATIIFIVLAALAALMSVDGTKYSWALAVLIVASPIALYLSLTRPIVFPFGLFVLLLPFDNVMPMSSFGTMTKLLGAASGVAIALYALRTKRFVAPPTVALIWYALLLWAGASIYWAIDTNMASSQYQTYAMVIGLYLLLCCVRVSKDDLRLVLTAVLLGGVLAAIFGAYYYYAHPTATGLHVTGDRAIIQVGLDTIDPNHFSNALALPMAIAVGLALRTRLSLKKFMYLTCIIVLLAGYYFASSRGAFVGLGAMFVYFFIRSRQRLQLIPVLGIASAMSAFLQTSLWTRFSLALSSGGAGRFAVWGVGLSALKQHWVLGAGVGNFRAAYAEQYIAVFQNYAKPQWDRVAHDLLIQSGVEFGIIGLALVLIGFGAQFFVLRDIDANNRFYDLRIALEAAVIALFVGSLSVDMLWYKYLWEAFIMIALLRTVARNERQFVLSARTSAHG